MNKTLNQRLSANWKNAFFCLIFLLFFLFFSFLVWKTLNSWFWSAFGVCSTQRLIKIYNMQSPSHNSILDQCIQLQSSNTLSSSPWSCILSLTACSGTPTSNILKKCSYIGLSRRLAIWGWLSLRHAIWGCVAISFLGWNGKSSSFCKILTRNN